MTTSRSLLRPGAGLVACVGVLLAPSTVGAHGAAQAAGASSTTPDFQVRLAAGAHLQREIALQVRSAVPNRGYEFYGRLRLNKHGTFATTHSSHWSFTGWRTVRVFVPARSLTKIEAIARRTHRRPLLDVVIFGNLTDQTRNGTVRRSFVLPF